MEQEIAQFDGVTHIDQANDGAIVVHFHQEAEETITKLLSTAKRNDYTVTAYEKSELDDLRMDMVFDPLNKLTTWKTHANKRSAGHSVR